MKKEWIHNGNFKVTSEHVSNGKMIKVMIPRKVTGVFDCTYLELTSLEGSPKTVGGDFNCYNNKLTSLEGSPKTVGEHFECSNNNLTSLEGSPKSITGSFWCYNNKVNLKIEANYIKSDFRNDNYWMDLLKYMIDNKLDLTEVKSWPKNFLTDNTIRSTKGISKFLL